MPSAKIIEFPKSRIVRAAPPPSLDSFQEEKKRKTDADSIIDHVGQGLFEELTQIHELPDNDKFFQKDFSFMYDTLRAVVYRAYGLKHTLHKVIDKSVIFATEEEFNNSSDEDVIVKFQPMYIVKPNEEEEDTVA